MTVHARCAPSVQAMARERDAAGERAMPGWLEAQMPFERRDVVAAGTRLSVIDAGSREGRPILFLHGNPTWSFVWRRLMGPARRSGFRVVAPDHAGFGLSEKPLDPAYHSLQRHVDNLRAIASALDLQDVVLVLHDWGGPIGMGLAAQEPERIARIVVANTAAFAPTKARPLTRWHQAFASPPGYRAGVALNLVARTALRGGVQRPLARAARRGHLWPMRERGARVAAGRFVQMVPDGPDHPEAATLRRFEAGYARLQATPMLVLWADKDPVLRPRLAERWQKTFPRAQVHHVAPDAGHFWQEDAPEAFLPRILAFAAQR